MSKYYLLLIPFALMVLVVACGRSAAASRAERPIPAEFTAEVAPTPVARDYDDPAVEMTDRERRLHGVELASTDERRDDDADGGSSTRRAPNALTLFLVGLGLVLSGWNVARLFRGGKGEPSDALTA